MYSNRTNVGLKETYHYWKLFWVAHSNRTNVGLKEAKSLFGIKVDYDSNRTNVGLKATYKVPKEVIRVEFK